MLFQSRLFVVTPGTDARASHMLGKHSTNELISSLVFVYIFMHVYVRAHVHVCVSAHACTPQDAWRSQRTVLTAGPRLLPCLRQGLSLVCTTVYAIRLFGFWRFSCLGRFMVRQLQGFKLRPSQLLGKSFTHGVFFPARFPCAGNRVLLISWDRTQTYNTPFETVDRWTSWPSIRQAAWLVSP